MNKVHVYFAGIKQFTANEFSSLLVELPALKRDSINRLRLQKDQNASLSAYLLLKEALKQNGLAISDYEYGIGEYGKPFLKNCPLNFSISHSNNYCLVVLSEAVVGCDIEEIAERSSRVMRIFIDADRDYISSQSDKLLAFHQIWTAKEAYVKALGTGLHTPFNSFEITHEPKTENVGCIDTFCINDSYVCSVYSPETSEFMEPIKIDI